MHDKKRPKWDYGIKPEYSTVQYRYGSSPKPSGHSFIHSFILTIYPPLPSIHLKFEKKIRVSTTPSKSKKAKAKKQKKKQKHV